MGGLRTIPRLLSPGIPSSVIRILIVPCTELTLHSTGMLISS